MGNRTLYKCNAALSNILPSCNVRWIPMGYGCVLNVLRLFQSQIIPDIVLNDFGTKILTKICSFSKSAYS